MSGDTANPRIWLNADVYVAPVGTANPTDIATALPGTWVALGLLAEDGMVLSGDADVTDHFAYGGIHVRTTRSKHKSQITVSPLEDTPVVFGLVRPGSDADTAAGVTTRTVMIPTADPRAFLLETRDGAITRRRVIPRGEVIEVGDETMSDSDMTAPELTIAIYADGDGVQYVDITDDPQAVVA